MADSVKCYGCGKMFEPWTNEWFCSETCEANYPHDKWPRAKFSTEDHTAWDDYWWEQRLNDASFAQGQEDKQEGREPRSVHPWYVMGYDGEEKPREDSKSETPFVVVRSWLQR